MRHAKVAAGMAFLLMVSASAVRGATPPASPVVVAARGTQVTFTPQVPYGELLVSVRMPDGGAFTTSYKRGEEALLDFSTPAGPLPDGPYGYELKVLAKIARKGARSEAENAIAGLVAGGESPLIQSGVLLMRNGALVAAESVRERGAKPERSIAAAAPVSGDVVNADDFIVQGSLCVGFDCVNNENFSFDTIRLKENNTQIAFDDTSVGSFPANDWTIVANDSISGGTSYLAFRDVTGSKVPFTVMAGAPTNSLYVDASGQIGAGTSTPVLDMHVLSGNTPAMRLEQDASGGYTAQTWDLAGNEANFFIRDVTGGSRLPFRIQPGAPTNSLTVKSDGRVGFGTWSPEYPLEVERTGSNATIVTDRTDGAKSAMKATASDSRIGTLNNFPLVLVANGAVRLTLKTNNSMVHANGATLTSGGVWQNASSRALKENIGELTAVEARAALRDLTPVRYNYKADAAERHVGFIAEDVPELVAAKDRASLSPMDIAAVLTRVMQEQQRVIEQQQEAIRTLGEKFLVLEARVDKLRGRVVVGSRED